jgi:hypothetical protein
MATTVTIPSFGDNPVVSMSRKAIRSQKSGASLQCSFNGRRRANHPTSPSTRARSLLATVAWRRARRATDIPGMETT